MEGSCSSPGPGGPYPETALSRGRAPPAPPSPPGMVRTCSPSAPAATRGSAAWRSHRRVEAVQHDDGRTPERRQRVEGQAHRVDGAQTRVGDQHDDVGRERGAESRQSPSAARGDRSPPAVSTSPTSSGSVAAGQRTSATRSSMVKGGRPSTSAAIGGAIAVSYQRCGGQTTSAGSPVAAPRTAASRAGGVVVGIEGLRRLAGGHLQARGAKFGQQTGGNPCLADVGPRADDGNHSAGAHAGQRAAGAGVAAGRGNSASACNNRADIVVAVRSRQRDPQATGADRHGGRADGRDPQAVVEQRRRRRRAPPARCRGPPG